MGEIRLSPDRCWPIDTTYFIDEFPAGVPIDYWSLQLKSLRLGQEEKSSAIPGISRDDIYGLTVSVPPRNEQERIAAKLDALLAKLDACRNRLVRIPILLKRFRQSVLAAACSGRLTADWRQQHEDAEPVSAVVSRLKSGSVHYRVRRGVPETVPLSDVARDWELPDTWGVYSAAELLRIGILKDVKDGNHGANHPKVSEFTAQGVPFITASQVNSYSIDYEGAYKVSGKALERLRVGFARPGDVIYTHKGSVGRVAIADRDCILTPQTTYYRVSSEIVNNGYLMFYLSSQFFSTQADIVKEQTTRDFVPISEQYLFFHRVPPISEQLEIVNRVKSLFALADKIEARYVKAKAQIDKLTPSVLAKAFRGELVPTEAELARREGRDYEPASVLLERIRAVRLDTAIPIRIEPLKYRAHFRRSKKTEDNSLNRKDVQDTHLASILKQHGPLTAEALWSASQLAIDDFYDQLKDEEGRGLLKETHGDLPGVTRLLEAVL